MQADTNCTAIPFITGEDGKLLPAVLEYFTEGIMPFLHVFFSTFFDPPSDSAVANPEIKVSVQIAQALNVSFRLA